jgi:hypothetical protein
MGILRVCPPGAVPFRSNHQAVMNSERQAARRAEAVAQLESAVKRADATELVARLDAGLELLRNTFFTRVQGDVERIFGVDSMIDPLSLAKSEARSHDEIDLFQVAESAAAVHEARYLPVGQDWYRRWLGRLRMGEHVDSPSPLARLEDYAAKDADDRRRTFSVVLERTLPEATRAPLVIYRLLPLAVAVATAAAFGDTAAAAALRQQQIATLPSVADCSDCAGRVLPNGKRCSQCGNPLWKHEWLTD